MRRIVTRCARFTWRLFRNVLCTLPGGARLLFPPEALAQRFGRGDAQYAVSVYLHHARLLAGTHFAGAARVLETGPGRNLGSALLWWCRARAEGKAHPSVALWDVHVNAHPDESGFWQELARALLPVTRHAATNDALLTAGQLGQLGDVAQGTLQPDITYLVCPLDTLLARLGSQGFDLLLSHAALEHVWQMDEYWRIACALGNPGAWQSHRIDLADHGRRQGHYLEMCEWSPCAWWMTMRFIPGAINRWRAHQHRRALERGGYRIVSEFRETRLTIPVPRTDLAMPFRVMPEGELRTTAVDLIAQREEHPCGC